MAIILKANKVNLFIYFVLFVFWYHSPNFLDTPRISLAFTGSNSELLLAPKQYICIYTTCILIPLRDTESQIILCSHLAIPVQAYYPCVCARAHVRECVSVFHFNNPVTLVGGKQLNVLSVGG
jgi:hypothetical protein